MDSTRYVLVADEFLRYDTVGGRPRASSPDGDSVACRPDRPEFLRQLGDPPRNAEIQPGGRVQVRLEGIDALELHYRGHRQKRPQCVSARGALLRMLGFARVQYHPSTTAHGIPMRVRGASPHPVPGYILVRQVDPNGRPVAFAFAGGAARGSVRSVRVSSRHAAHSVNARLLEAGHAYPAFYRTLPAPLRRALNRCAQRACAARVGIWAVDRTTTGVRVTAASDLIRAAIWPKLFRRLTDYLRGARPGGDGALSGFLAWLQDRRFPSRDDGVELIDGGRRVARRLRAYPKIE